MSLKELLFKKAYLTVIHNLSSWFKILVTRFVFCWLNIHEVLWHFIFLETALLGVIFERSYIVKSHYLANISSSLRDTSIYRAIKETFNSNFFKSPSQCGQGF